MTDQLCLTVLILIGPYYRLTDTHTLPHSTHHHIPTAITPTGFFGRLQCPPSPDPPPETRQEKRTTASALHHTSVPSSIGLGGGSVGLQVIRARHIITDHKLFEPILTYPNLFLPILPFSYHPILKLLPTSGLTYEEEYERDL